jgi:hypothetical protein
VPAFGGSHGERRGEFDAVVGAHPIPFAFGVFVYDHDAALAAVDPDVEGNVAVEVAVDCGGVLG